ncbi:fasciclin domain-containing protein [Brevundimonas lutea]|uniref:fasciclin domain-containing protein n=1 Tax=Brevundimonas lutea TaxID=2293980 RepID=UPI000F01AF07|nr:fasciclin domain-containing protein [Brevundimonas lutea]
MKTSSIALIAAASLGLATAACSQEPAEPATPAEPMAADAMAAEPAASTNIVQAAQASPDFSTLVTAVQAAGLVETLSGPGPFTVFAPTNAAFDALPAGTVENLTQPAQQEQLQGILTYHVVQGNLMAADIVAQAQANGGSTTVTTVQGEDLTVNVSGSTVTITDAAGGTATVTTPDLAQSNGVIHGIDAVLMPE